MLTSPKEREEMQIAIQTFVARFTSRFGKAPKVDFPEGFPKLRLITLRQIFNAVEDSLYTYNAGEFSHLSIRSRTKRHPVLLMHKHAYYYIARGLKYGLEVIADESDADHATVRHGSGVFKKELETNTEYQQLLRNLGKKLKFDPKELSDNFYNKSGSRKELDLNKKG